MLGLSAKNRSFLAATLSISFAAAGCSHLGKKSAVKSPPKDQTASAEPDKVLYDRSMDDLKRGHYLEGRLSLEALINTYPESEYLAKAKLAMGDSYYQEGGASNLTLAINQYQDFQTFFPFLTDEAAYAQMRVGMAHYRMMEKPDRDSTQVQAAEDAFQTFLLKYPQSKLVPEAEQRLREVQEVLADGEFRIGEFYYVKQDYPAAAARFIEISERYPLYSRSDATLSMLADVYMRAKQLSKNEDDKNHWADLAGECYARIVRDYPLSGSAPQAKERLRAMGMQVPSPDPQALARMQKQQMYEKNHHPSVLALPLALFKTGPNVSSAARAGDPNLNPPTDAVSATQVLLPGAPGPAFGVSAKPAESAGSSNGAADPVPSGSGGADTNSIGSGAGVQIIAAPATGESIPPPATAAQPAGGSTTPAAATTTGSAASGSPASQGSSEPAAKSGSGAKKPKAGKADKNTESTSKKKKGMKKLVFW